MSEMYYPLYSLQESSEVDITITYQKKIGSKKRLSNLYKVI